MLQDWSNISLLAELELKLSTLDPKSCILMVLKWETANKQASKQTYNPLDTGVEEVNIEKP